MGSDGTLLFTSADWLICPKLVANLTILEADPLAVDPKTLKDIPIWGTVYEGRVFPITR
jgi:hypothetical protein